MGDNDTAAATPVARSRIPYGGSSGAASAALGIGIGELTAGALGTQGPVVVVADATVDASPQPAKELAISLFGTYDKLVLLLGIGVVLLLAAVGIGKLASTRPHAAVAAVLLFGVVGVCAVFLRRVDEPVAAIPVLLAVVVASGALWWFARSIPTARTQSSIDLHDRRRLLQGVAGAFVVAAGSGALGRMLTSGASADDARRARGLPKAADPLPPLPEGSDLRVRGLAPFVTPNSKFYRIDTALTVPRLATEEWQLRIHGLVDRPIVLGYEELIDRPLVEADVTLTCVSNEVGGELVGNSRWLGVRLGDLLREAGVHATADMVLSTSTDGWNCGTPAEAVLDDRNTLLAIGMNGEPLPFEHGFPVRVVVPGLYGYVSATKWVTDIELTRFADKQAYWTQRGWAERGPIKTMSRIDVPRQRSLSAGRNTIAGVAWAQHRGIDAVEVRIDDGPWQQAELATVPGIDTWRQWRLDVPLERGDYAVQVRATDATGHTQTARQAPPVPNGASGWHTVQISVAE